jgi:hypothetical protein
MAVSGLAVAYTALGGVILWSGIKGETLTNTVKGLASGQVPAANQQPIGSPSLGITPGTSTAANTAANTSAKGVGASGPVTASTVTSIQNYALARMIASTYGWGTGQEFASVTELINAESGGNSLARNASGAFGIAQALGHGTANTAGTYGNEYGNYGVPDSTSKAANSGSASAQLIWMMAYIKATYGDPVKAWAFHVQNGYY